jgi:cell division protein FtsB
MQQQEPVVQPAKAPKVELGNNSLLLIAFIVTLCSGSEQYNQNETQKEIAELRATVARLEQKVDKLNAGLPPAAAPVAADKSP